MPGEQPGDIGRLEPKRNENTGLEKTAEACEGIEPGHGRGRRCGLKTWENHDFHPSRRLVDRYPQVSHVPTMPFMFRRLDEAGVPALNQPVVLGFDAGW